MQKLEVVQKCRALTSRSSWGHSVCGVPFSLCFGDGNLVIPTHGGGGRAYFTITGFDFCGEQSTSSHHISADLFGLPVFSVNHLAQGM